MHTVSKLSWSSCLCVALAACGSSRISIGTVEHAEPRSAPIASLVVSLDRGQIDIRPAAVDEIRIEVEVLVREDRAAEFKGRPMVFGDHVALDQRADGSVFVRSAHEGSADGDDFELRITVQVPGTPEVRVKLDAGSASVKLQAAHGFSASIDAGQLDAEFGRVEGDAEVRIDAGQIRMLVRDSLGSLDAAVSAGQIDVTLPTAYAGRIDAQTSVGAVQIAEHLGIDVKRDVVAQSAIGVVGAGGEAAIVLRVDTGQIRLR